MSQSVIGLPSSRWKQPIPSVTRRTSGRVPPAPGSGGWLPVVALVVAASIPILALTDARSYGALAIAGLSIAAAALFFAAGDLRALAALLVGFGLAEPLLASATGSSAVLYPDSIMLVLVLLSGVARVRPARGNAARVTAAFAVLLAVAILRAPSLGQGVYQAREVIVPAGLVAVGYLAKDRIDRRLLVRVTLVAGAISAVYMIFEYVLGPVISPWAFEGLNGFTRLNVNSALPGNYYFYYSTGHAPLLRLGGLLLNPPASGLFMATVTIIAAQARWPVVYKAPAVALFAAATVGTYSRAGILLAGMAIVLPKLGRMGRLAPALACAVAAWLALPVLLHEGRSASHLQGLISGISTSLTHPLGVGFGHFGNVAKAFHGNGPGESLVGLFIAALGLPGLVLVVGLIYWLIARLPDSPEQASLALAGLAAASLSESTASLTATAALWLLVGIAVGDAKDQHHHVMGAVEDVR